MTHIVYGFALKDQGINKKIFTSWCSCIAGTSEVCNHLIALLYKVNYAFKKNYISPACTSIPQGWNGGTKKEVAPGQTRHLKFIKHRRTRKDTNGDPAIEQELRGHFDSRKIDRWFIC